MTANTETRLSRLDRAAETLAALLAIVLYVVAVSRGEVLPYDGPARAATAPLLALLVAALAGWRLRLTLAALWRSGARRRWWPVIPLMLAALGLRLLAGALARPPGPAELAVVQAALATINNGVPDPADPAVALLGWLHAPLAGLRYVAGVSSGLWEKIRQVPPEALLPWSRAFHLLLNLAGLAAVTAALARVARPPAALLALALLAVSGASLRAGTAVDLGAPAGLLAALALWLAMTWLPVGRLAVLARSRAALAAAALAGLAVLWLPGWPAAALAPVAAAASATALTALWERRRRAWDAPPPTRANS